MGVMSAARARLGLHLSSEKNISSLVSQFIRKSSTCSSIVPESKKKTLYLSFVKNESDGQGGLEKFSHIVRPIKFDDSHNNTKIEECKDAIHSPILQCSNEDLRYYRSNTVSTRFGSRILFQNYGESHISWVDPTTHPPQFQASFQIPLKSKIPSLPNRTYGYMDFGEIDHKLYCIRDDDIKRVFEVLESDNWRPLIPPPEGCSNIQPEEFLFLNRSKKILYWRQWKCGVYVYDVMVPEKGWVELNHPTLRDALPFLVRSDRLFLIDDLHHPSLGDFNLVFNLVVTDECDLKRGVVYPFLLSENCSTFQCINNPIDLPPEMEIRGSKFVNLGDRKFCIIVHNPWVTTLVLTYEYDVIVSSDYVLEIQTRLLGTRIFRTRDDGSLSHIVGAFLL